MSRASLRIVIPLLIGAGVIIAFWVLVLEPIQARQQWSNRITAALWTLPAKRPSDVPPGQWEFMVGWTMNLHSNWTWVDPNEMWPFLEEFERRLERPLSAATIDWLWDEYARITNGGKTYSDRYRPTRSPDLEIAQPGCFGMFVK